MAAGYATLFSMDMQRTFRAYIFMDDSAGWIWCLARGALARYIIRRKLLLTD